MNDRYPIELRELAVNCFLAGKGTAKELAEQYGVSPRTLEYWVARFRATGKVEPLPRGGGNRSRIRPDILDELVRTRPDWTSYELTAAYNRKVGRAASVSRSSIIRALSRCGYVFKKNATDRRSKIGPTSPSNVRVSQRR